MLLVAGMLALLAASPDADRARERAAAVLAADDYQVELPREAEPPRPLRLGWLEWLLRAGLWGGLALFAVLLAAWLVRRLGRRPLDAEAPEPEAPRPVPIPIESAEALAAAGRFGEAIHALLLETLAALARAARLPRSLTSREIVARVLLPERARDALVALVLAVELSRFGGEEPGEPDYRACLGRFREFLATYREAA